MQGEHNRKQSESEMMSDLIKKYGEEIKRLIFTYVKEWNTAEDLTQDVFITVYLKRDTFQEQSSLKTWIYRIAINKSKDYLKSWGNRMLSLTNLFPSSYSDISTERRYFTRFENEKLGNAVFKLPVKYREVIILYYYKGLNTTEISELLQCKPSTVKSRISRAKKQLHSKLGGFRLE
ncbi:sigma-70 family RNA polymerase sigma factor [Falsibacillus albus]|uniref:RNA polymerase sigma factor n=1 Tax=Falsibacillus albus TaxID=2478915 RepID=A0A3L7JXG7_9BACI|nr:sigma-70 family RNA polymerase sigma factor [Falsibacillus albus]RLQ94361.1 sigma-70 family RNA polymerase sigma factor [Falsibacillus albus]